MLSRSINTTLLKRVNNAAFIQVARISAFERRIIGNREVVGFGFNAFPGYDDNIGLPFPAIRYKEIKGDLIPLREKEKGDWKKLTIDEKKKLYRASFCQTFAELEAPTGHWKVYCGCTFLLLGATLWATMGLIYFFCAPLHSSLSEESQKAQLRRMLDLKVNPMTGVSSKWDYENDCWKK